MNLVLIMGLFSSAQLFSMEQNNTNITERVQRLEFNHNSIANSIAKLEDPDKEAVLQKIINELNKTIQNVTLLDGAITVDRQQIAELKIANTALTNLIVPEVNNTAKVLEALCSIIIETGMLTREQVIAKIRNSNRTVGITNIQ